MAFPVCTQRGSSSGVSSAASNTTRPFGSGLHPITSFSHTYLLKDLISKYGHTAGQDFNLWIVGEHSLFYNKAQEQPEASSLCDIRYFLIGQNKSCGQALESLWEGTTHMHGHGEAGQKWDSDNNNHPSDRRPNLSNCYIL